MKKSELRQLIREEIRLIREDTYTTNVKNRDEFFKEMGKLSNKIQKHWGKGTIRQVETNTNFKRSIFKRIKQKFKNTAPIFQSIRIYFKDMKKSPVEYVEIAAMYVENPTGVSKRISGFDLIPSDGWSGNGTGGDWHIKDDKQLDQFFKDNEEWYSKEENWGK